MSTPIDLSNALKTPPPSVSSRPGGSKGAGRGPQTRLDDIARPVLWTALAVTALLLIYVGWGLFGGAWANPTWDSLKADLHRLHLYHQVQMANIGLVFDLLRVAAVVLLVTLVICCLHDEGVGYVLLGTAAALFFGLPLLAGQIYVWQNLRATEASQAVLRQMQILALFYGVPGLIWTAVDLVRRLQASAEAAAIRRASLQHAQASGARALGVRTPKRGLTAEQRQYRTYQTCAVIILIAEPLLVLLNLGTVEVWVGRLLAAVERITNRFSFSANPGGIAPLHTGDNIVLWTVLIALNLVLLAQVLRLLEYFFFRRKV
ncbi:MAG: hypothetical protein JO250_10910 [Armatimonadetes bacterium]|nr:hypothetical protein [Armatimonadota bacterium]